MKPNPIIPIITSGNKNGGPPLPSAMHGDQKINRRTVVEKERSAFGWGVYNWKEATQRTRPMYGDSFLDHPLLVLACPNLERGSVLE